MSSEPRASRPLLVAMCGLPGSGKSTLSRALAARLGALRWDKDELRHLLFPPAHFAHDRDLNDRCMEILYRAAEDAFRRHPPARLIILDGRPYAEMRQRQRARAAAAQAGADIVFVLCTAPVAVLRKRVSGGEHLAADRDAALVDRLHAAMEPFDGDEITVDTATHPAEEAAAHCVRQMTARGYLDTMPQ